MVVAVLCKHAVQGIEDFRSYSKLTVKLMTTKRNARSTHNHLWDQYIVADNYSEYHVAKGTMVPEPLQLIISKSARKIRMPRLTFSTMLHNFKED